jgi:hypothetical protein
LQLPGHRLDAKAAAIDLSAAGLDERRERWIAADASIAGAHAAELLRDRRRRDLLSRRDATWPD